MTDWVEAVRRGEPLVKKEWGETKKEPRAEWAGMTD